MQYEINPLDENNYYASQSNSQTSHNFVHTGFQDRYYSATFGTIGPQSQSQGSITSRNESSQQHVPSPPPQVQQPPPPSHQSNPTSINSLLTHDTPPPT